MVESFEATRRAHLMTRRSSRKKASQPQAIGPAPSVHARAASSRLWRWPGLSKQRTCSAASATAQACASCSGRAPSMVLCMLRALHNVLR